MTISAADRLARRDRTHDRISDHTDDLDVAAVLPGTESEATADGIGSIVEVVGEGLAGGFDALTKRDAGAGINDLADHMRLELMRATR